MKTERLVYPDDTCCLICRRVTYGWALEAHYRLWHWAVPY